MNEQEALVFEDLTPIEVPVSIAGKKYILREASGDAAVKYRNAWAACSKLDMEGKFSRLENIADLEPLLVSMCLFDAETGKPVSEQTIRAWPARVLRRLHSKAKEIGGLDDRDDEPSLRRIIADTQKRLDALLKEKESPRPNAR